MADTRIAVVIPALNEAGQIASLLEGVVGVACEVVLVDGGSHDDTAARAGAAGARVIPSPRGRAAQMNAGARALGSDWQALLFLHADTRLPTGWAQAVTRALAGGARWGRFDVMLDSPRPALRMVEASMNLRSRLTGICTGDQAIFVERGLWARCGGYAAIPLMEDIELSRRLKRLAPGPAALRERVRVSARRWEKHGVWRTILSMWWLRLRYFLGDSPERLHRAYYGKPR